MTASEQAVRDPAAVRRSLGTVCGMTWGWTGVRGTWATTEAEHSMRQLAGVGGVTWMTVAFAAVQATAQTSRIPFREEPTVTDREVRWAIREAWLHGVRVCLKPTVNCADGTWRAFIGFFDQDVPGEPSWTDWFSSYRAFILHYARIAQEVLFWSFIAMLMVPYHVTLIPTFIIISQAGGVNTYWGLILPTLASAQAVFLMRQFILSLPDDLFEAARLDGCSEWRLYTSIVLPLIKPILATLGVFVFLWHWNDFLWPLVVGQSTEMRTLTTGLASLNQENAPLNVVFAGSVIAFVPIFMAYLVAQRYIAEGVTMSGIKG